MQYIVNNSYEEFSTRRNGFEFHFDGKRARVIILRTNTDDELVHIFDNNEVFFQLFLREEIVFLLIKFQGLNWVDIPFIAHKPLNLHPPDETKGYDIDILFANSTSGKLYVKRSETLSPGLSKALFWAAYRQIKNPPGNIQSRINKVHACFSSDEMARLSLGK